MKALSAGKYFCDTKRTVDVCGLIISDTEYIDPRDFPVHYHENLYLAYVIKGHYSESTNKDKIHCLPGSVVLHNVCEKHSNSDFSGYSRIINLEIENRWLLRHKIEPGKVESNVKDHSVEVQCCMSKIAGEYLQNDFASRIEIEANVMRILANILSCGSMYLPGIPKWVKTVREFINEGDTESLNLKFISDLAGIHPVHLSRDFPRYFNASFGGYIRKVKIERSKHMLADKRLPLISIAHDSGFSDQSHFTRIFRKFTGVTPNEYRMLTRSPVRGNRVKNIL